MANQNTVIQYSFSTGVVSPGVRNRKDWDRIDSAVAEGLNGTVTPSGGFAKRPGFRFINECLHHDKPIRKVTFRFSRDQVYELEFGDYLMRFYKDGGLILNDDGTPYVLATPYSAEEAQAFTPAQERDAMFFAHWDKPLKQLTRHSHNNWVWSDVFQELDEEGNPVERIASPSHIEWYGNDGNGHNGYEYAVTSYRIVDGTPQESINFPTIFSDPDAVDFIGQAPQDNIASCLNWRDQYGPRHGDVDGFPVIPDIFDIRSVTLDSQAPASHPLGGGGLRGLNDSLFDVLALRFPTLYSGGLGYYTVSMGTRLRIWEWILWDSGGNDLFSTIYLVTNSNNNQNGVESSLDDQWEGYSDGPYDTWVMIHVANAFINTDQVSADGHTKTSIYNDINSFIESFNEANSQKLSNHIAWPAVEGADGYYVYRRLRDNENKKFWQVASVASTVTDWKDEDVTETEIHDKNPITGLNEFGDPDTHPNLVTFYQQRMVLGCTKEKPTSIFGSRTGIYRDYAIDPSDDSSGYEFKMASETSDPLVSILPLYTLAILTNGGDFISTVSGAMNASNVNFNQKSYNGASSVRPVILGDAGIYVPLSQKGVNTMAYSYERDGFRHDNILFNAQHYISGKTITGLAFQRDPINLIWAVLSDGTLLSCLYIPEQNFVAWSRHRTNGRVKSINMVPMSDGVDVISAVVERTLGDGSKRQYIEYLENMLPYSEEPNAENSFYVDSGLSGYFDAEVQTITGLDHLEGLEVVILADNCVVAPRTVINGTITLDRPAKTVHVGLQYDFHLKTLRFDLADQTLRDTRSKISRCVAEVLDTRDLEWSANSGPWNDLIVHYADNMGEPALQNGDLELKMLSLLHSRGAYMEFRSRRPLPCTVNSLVAQITRGD